MGMKHTEEAIALQAIEFWSTVCETEAELAWEAAEVRDLRSITCIDISSIHKLYFPN